MQRVSVVPDDRQAELADRGHLFDREFPEVDDTRRLDNAGPGFSYRPRVAGAAEQDDSLRRRLVGHDREALGRPERTRSTSRPAAASPEQHERPVSTEEG